LTRIFLPLQHTHESELTREWLIHALRLLKVGGVLFVSIDSRKKQSLENLIHKYFTSIQLLPSSRRKGALWILRKKTKDKIPSLPSFRSYTAKDGETIARFCSQTGVFAHGRIDDGARALLKVVEVLPEDRILDLGCGAGEIGILSALRSPKTSLVLTDSNTRAIQVAQVNAESLLPHRFQTLLSPQIAETYSGAPFSLILTNPPYFSHYSISQAFLQAISKLLHPQGRFYLVTKQQEWHRQAIQKDFILVAEYQKLGYTIFLAQQKPSSSESTKDEVLRTP
jgi:16S rRNA G1207 methylase RsmC